MRIERIINRLIFKLSRNKFTFMLITLFFVFFAFSTFTMLDFNNDIDTSKTTALVVDGKAFGADVVIKIHSDVQLDDYQVKVPLNTNGITHIRFQTLDGQVLPYWIEHDENGNPDGIVWIKTSLQPGDNYVLAYYDPSQSPDGDSVFEFFDDFDGTSLDTGKWDISQDLGNNWVISFSNSILSLKYDGSESGEKYWEINSKRKFNSNYIFETLQKGSWYGQKLYGYFGFKNNVIIVDNTDENGNNNGYQYTKVSSCSVGSNPSESGSEFHNYKIVWGSNYINFYKDTLELSKNVCEYPTEETTAFIRINNHKTLTNSNSRIWYFDYIFVRKYSSTEPSVTVFGSLSTSQDSKVLVTLPKQLEKFNQVKLTIDGSENIVSYFSNDCNNWIKITSQDYVSVKETNTFCYKAEIPLGSVLKSVDFETQYVEHDSPIASFASNLALPKYNVKPQVSEIPFIATLSRLYFGFRTILNNVWNFLSRPFTITYREVAYNETTY